MAPQHPRHHLEGALGYHQFGPAEIWDTLREWLETQGVAPPADLGAPPLLEDKPDVRS